MGSTIDKVLTLPAMSTEIRNPFGHKMFDFVGPVGPQCLDMESYGVGDMEKRTCSLAKFVTAQPDCVIISLGSNNQWGFEEAVYKALPCRIETFDCTVPNTTRPPKSIADRTTFHHVCAAAKDQTYGPRVFKSWRSILSMINATAAPLYLKMDIEGFEYQVIRSIVEDGALMPVQIAFELHYNSTVPRSSAGRIVTFMDYIRREGGYFLIDRNDNAACRHCTELLVSLLPCGALSGS